MTGEPCYARLGGMTCFTVWHDPAGTAGGVGVLVLPPFGWEEVCSYRARRDWAVHLADRGHTALRIDLPATGDSAGSPRDTGLVEMWTGAVTDAAQLLRERPGVARVVAIGLGLGGMLATAAVAAGAAIDDLVLWGVPARGRALVRELRMFARLEEWQRDDAAGAAPGDGSLLVGGALMSPETVRDVAALDLSARGLSGGTGRRALLLERDGLPPDPVLCARLEHQGWIVAIAPGEGFGHMVDRPHMSRAPTGVFDRVDRWIAEVPVVPATHDAGADCASEMRLGGGPRAVVERALSLAGTFGIVAAPAEGATAPVGVVLLNAGPIRRIGPGRLWVEMARRWAARGIASVRLDVAGVGDADGRLNPYSPEVGLYEPSYVSQVTRALDELEAHGFPGRLVVIGLCSGSYWGLWAAARDPRIQAVFLINPRAIIMDAQLRRMRSETRKMTSLGNWAKVLRGDASWRDVLRRGRLLLRAAAAAGASMPGRIARRLGGAGGGAGDPVDDLFDGLRDTGRRVVFLFSEENEPLDEQLTADGRFDGARWPDVEKVVLAGTDHTLRPLVMQRAIHAELDRLLDRELGARTRG